MMNLMTYSAIAAFLCVSTTCTLASAFQVASPISISRSHMKSPSQSLTALQDATTDVEELLQTSYPMFYNLIISKNADVWKVITSPSTDPDVPSGFTIFAPNDEAMNKLGKKKLDQLLDDRNRETAEKIASFHAVAEPVGAWDLITSGGIVTVGGVVDVGKSKVGGFFGFGGEEDGGVTVSGAKILETKMVESCVVHEMDGLISPDILWRYMDQLRIL